MGVIVCAIRGGQGSLAVRRRAIAIARETGSSIIFLSVVDASALAEEGSPLEAALHAELTWMSRVLGGIARQHAENELVPADVVIRVGRVHEEIVDYLRATTPDLFLLGAPRGTTANVFGDDAVEAFALSLQEETGVRVVIARPEESVKQGL